MWFSGGDDNQHSHRHCDLYTKIILFPGARIILFPVAKTLFFSAAKGSVEIYVQTAE